MLKDYVKSIMNCNNLFAVANVLEELLFDTKGMALKNKFLQDIIGRLAMINFYARQKEVYVVHSANNAVLQYLLNYWIFKRTYKENAKCLTGIINTHSNILPPQKSIISESAIHELMKMIERRFGFCSKILADNPLEILLIEHAHATLNGIYTATLIEDDILEDKIIITYLRDKVNFPQEFIFLHELGHALHTRATGKLTTPPESFNLVLTRMFPKSLNEPDTIKSELFADSFAMAALYGSELAHYNPYTEIYHNDNLLLVAYMFDLIQKSF